MFAAAGDHATLGNNGRVIARADFARVVAFAEDYEYRGIKVALRSGEDVALVTEFSLSASSGIGYSRNELICETVWCSTLGRAIATWAGTDFIDLI